MNKEFYSKIIELYEKILKSILLLTKKEQFSFIEDLKIKNLLMLFKQ